MSDYYKKTRIEYDMLQGNINRMFVTDDYEELTKMYDFALYRLRKLKEFNAYRIQKNEEK